MLILGISDNFESGATLVEDGQIIAAVNEERLSRKRRHWDWPEQSIKEVFRISKRNPEDVDKVALASITRTSACDMSSPPLDRRLAMELARTPIFRILGGTELGISLYRRLNCRQNRFISWKRTREKLSSAGLPDNPEIIDHHIAHAASACFTAPFKDCLVITMDAIGDGYFSRVMECKNNQLKSLSHFPFYHTPVIYYAYITVMLGWHEGWHEGKVMGLAARGRPEPARSIISNRIVYLHSSRTFKNKGRWELSEISWLKKALKGLSREDICAGMQAVFQEYISQFVEHCHRDYGHDNIALAGGAFCNVILNGLIAQRRWLKHLWVHPHMGDGGIATGAALYSASRSENFSPSLLKNVYLGNEINRYSAEQAFKEASLNFTVPEYPAEQIADLIENGRIVAVAHGPMEYGPRALGCRSVLAKADDDSIVTRLNQCLHREEFMPFAPAILEEDAEELVNLPSAAKEMSEFMTLAVYAKSPLKKEAPSIVHIDNSVRPQIVGNDSAILMKEILTSLKNRFNRRIIINTSFNIHDEPIVCTARDAVRGYIESGIDALYCGGLLTVRKPLKSNND